MRKQRDDAHSSSQLITVAGVPGYRMGERKCYHCTALKPPAGFHTLC